MTNRSKQKGTVWESAIVKWLQSHGFRYVERRTLAGVNDGGGGAGLPGVVIEAKACKALTLSEWLNELDAEMVNANCDIGFVIAKRKGSTKVDDAYVVTNARTLLALLQDHR
jgi:hypothetical protein